MTLTETLVAQPLPLKMDEHGVLRVGGTRVTLDTLLDVYKRGETAEEIVDHFPTLGLADVHSVISYYLRHKEEVERYLERNEREAEELRKQIEEHLPTHALRERVRARQRDMQEQLKP